MPVRKQSLKKRIVYHKDGTVWAKGQMAGDDMAGYWEWFRKDGSKMRSGSFTKGVQVGEWKTYRKDGSIVKVTMMKPKQPR